MRIFTARAVAGLGERRPARSAQGRTARCGCRVQASGFQLPRLAVFLCSYSLYHGNKVMAHIPKNMRYIYI